MDAAATRAEALKSDEEIAKEVQAGRSEAFTVLVARYGEKLERYARRFLFAGDDMKDVLQDVFLKAYANIQSFDGEQRFSPWIYRIAHNELINAIKKRKSRQTFSLFDFDILLPHPAAPEGADDAAQRSEVRRMLDSCLDKLSVKYREPLILFYYQDLNYNEIADILRIPVSTVGVRLQRGKQMIKKMVER